VSDLTPTPDGKLSRAAAQRLSQYLRFARTLAEADGTVSSVELAEAVGVSAAQVRRDLAALGHLGQRGVGYDAAGLVQALRKAIGVDRRWRVVLVGVGNLAKALLKYRGFGEHGFDVVGLFDTSPTAIGRVVEGLTVEPMATLAGSVKRLRAELGVLTVPADAAQSVADAMAAAGLKGLMNFAPVRIKVPTGVRVVPVDLAIQLEQLAFAVHFHEADEPPHAEPRV
jgi:redox-sensing transcriptional repressor